MFGSTLVRYTEKSFASGIIRPFTSLKWDFFGIIRHERKETLNKTRESHQ